MPVATRQLPKHERQRLVVSIVQRRAVGTQHELIDALAKAGCAVTQATVSRDVREIGLLKETDAVGRARYVLPGRRRDDPAELLATVLRQFGRQATAAENVVVVHSEIGSAPAVARALDRLGHPLVVGTIAGDDTCLVVAASSAKARTLARELSLLIG